MAATSAVPKHAVGIDLGTTYSCVGVWKDGRAEIIANQFGERTTPSVVGFTDKERLVGLAAANQAARNPANTVFDAKRLIGRRYSDEVVQADRSLWPFKVVRGEGDKPMFEVEFKGERAQFAAEEISATVLQYMKQTASDFVGHEVTDVVITCPAYFSNEQRQATKDAGAIAGLNVLRIINEPTAAALAYGLNSTMKSGENNILVYDFGGGTLDCSILTIDSGVFEVKATGGDTHLGGEDIDNILVSHFAEEFKRKYKTDIMQSDRALRRLRTACERLKRTLSTAIEAPLEIESLHEGQDFYTRLSRARFSELCTDIWMRALAPIDTVLTDAGMKKTDIHEIVLVGGSTKIPQIQELLSAKFGGKSLNRSINPDEAIAVGATIQAAILTGTATGAAKDALLMDVISLSLGLEAAGGKMTTVVRRGTTIPCEVAKTFSTNRDNQDSVTVKVYEGERPSTRDNNLLGSFSVSGIPPMPRAKPQIEVKFSIDSDGLLTVKAEEKTSGVNASVTIDSSSRLTEAQIKKMLHEAELNAEADAKIKEISNWSNTVESFAINMQSKADDAVADPASGYLFKDHVTAEERATLSNTGRESLNWLEQNSTTFSLEDLKERQRHQEKIYGDIVAGVNQRMAAAYQAHLAANPPPAADGASGAGCGSGPCPDSGCGSSGPDLD